MTNGASVPDEQWRPVPLMEMADLYEVSNFGRIRSLHHAPPKIIAGGRDKDGYPIALLYRNKARRAVGVHRLVCAAFNGPPNILHCEAAHLDGDRGNARADNLKWVSKGENHYHRRLHGTSAGERHPRAKLTRPQALEVRRRSRCGESASYLAREFSISSTTVSDIRDGRRWKHLP